MGNGGTPEAKVEALNEGAGTGAGGPLYPYPDAS